MEHSIEKFMRRDFAEKKATKEPDRSTLETLVIVLLITAFFVCLALDNFGFTTVHAAGPARIRYQDVHSEAQLQEFLSENPGVTITNR